MNLKSILYRQEQEEIIETIIYILQLDDNKSITLYELDNNIEKQSNILALIPDIRKFFSFSTIIGVSEPDRAKRPYLSIIKQLCKRKYDISIHDCRLNVDGKDIRSKRYVFALNT
jgi:hypothetical protein